MNLNLCDISNELPQEFLSTVKKHLANRPDVGRSMVLHAPVPTTNNQGLMGSLNIFFKKLLVPQRGAPPIDIVQIQQMHQRINNYVEKVSKIQQDIKDDKLKKIQKENMKKRKPWDPRLVKATRIATKKGWQNLVPDDTRDDLVWNLMETITSNLGPEARLDKRMANLLVYAQKVELDIYQMVESTSDYYDLIAEKISKTHNELEARKLKNTEEQAGA